MPLRGGSQEGRRFELVQCQLWCAKVRAVTRRGWGYLVSEMRNDFDNITINGRCKANMNSWAGLVMERSNDGWAGRAGWAGVLYCGTVVVVWACGLLVYVQAGPFAVRLLVGSLHSKERCGCVHGCRRGS